MRREGIYETLNPVKEQVFQSGHSFGLEGGNLNRILSSGRGVFQITKDLKERLNSLFLMWNSSSNAGAFGLLIGLAVIFPMRVKINMKIRQGTHFLIPPNTQRHNCFI